MPRQMKSLNQLEVDLRDRVVMLYVNAGLPHDFRSLMDAKFTRTNWDSFDYQQKCTEARRHIQQAYRSRTNPENPALLGKLCSTNVLEKIFQCMESEVVLYGHARRDAARGSASYSCNQYSRSRCASAAVSQPAILEQQNELAALPHQATHADYQKVSCLKSQCVQPEAFHLFENNCIKLLAHSDQALASLVQELHTWNMDKRLCMNMRDGKADENLFITRLNLIEAKAQNAVKLLADLLQNCVSLREQLPQCATELDEFKRQVSQKILEFVQNSFIVWRQSHQVLRANNKFAADVRLLVGPTLPPNTEISPVSVLMYEEDDSKSDGLGAKSGTINGTTVASLDHVVRPSSLSVAEMNVNVSGRLGQMPALMNGATGAKVSKLSLNSDSNSYSWIAKFRDIKWKNEEGRRSGKENDASVTETKYAAVFEVKICIEGDNREHVVRCASLPMALFVHLSQNCKSHGNIFWNNAFSYVENGLFKTPKEVPWPIFEKAIVSWLSSHTCVRAEALAEHNVNFIKKCLVDGEEDVVTFTRFFSDKQAGPLAFNFWEWIFGVCELIVSDSLLLFLWQNGAVYGFADSKEAEVQLSESQMKWQSILLRFGTSPARIQAKSSKKESPVGLVITVMGNNEKVIKVEPLSKEQLQENNLHKRLVSEQLRRVFMLKSKSTDILNKNSNSIDWLQSLLPIYEQYYCRDTTSGCETIVDGHYVPISEESIVQTAELPPFSRCSDLDAIEPSIPPNLPLMETLTIDDLRTEIK